MKFIRISGYGRHNIAEDWSAVESPMTVVVATTDLSITPQQYKREMLLAAPATFVAMDEFEHDGPLEAATLVGLQRLAAFAEHETQQAIAYHWNAEMLLHARQVLANPGPTPLDIEQTRDVLLQLARHPNYSHQVVQCYVWTPDHPDDVTLLEMKDGAIKPPVKVREPE